MSASITTHLVILVILFLQIASLFTRPSSCFLVLENPLLLLLFGCVFVFLLMLAPEHVVKNTCMSNTSY